MRYVLLALLLALSTATSTHADSLGRLFFTPEQRAQLERGHTHDATAEDGSPSTVLTVNGIVQRKDGVRTVWINGAAHNSSHGGEPSAEVITVPGKSPPIKVKVGQKLLLNNGTLQSSHDPTE